MDRAKTVEAISLYLVPGVVVFLVAEVHKLQVIQVLTQVIQVLVAHVKTVVAIKVVKVLAVAKEQKLVDRRLPVVPVMVILAGQ